MAPQGDGGNFSGPFLLGTELPLCQGRIIPALAMAGENLQAIRVLKRVRMVCGLVTPSACLDHYVLACFHSSRWWNLSNHGI